MLRQKLDLRCLTLRILVLNSLASMRASAASILHGKVNLVAEDHCAWSTRMLIDLVGADRVVCGTDFPQGMAIKKPVEYVEAIPNITEKERQLILSENPARLLRL